jgi:hypothetical protein
VQYKLYQKLTATVLVTQFQSQLTLLFKPSRGVDRRAKIFSQFFHGFLDSRFYYEPLASVSHICLNIYFLCVLIVCCRRKRCSKEILSLAGEPLAAVESYEKKLKGLISKLEDVCNQIEGTPVLPLDVCLVVAKDVGEATANAALAALRQLSDNA